MSVFRDYERRVLALLAPGALSLEQIEAVARDGTLVSYEYSGSGYFLTVAHPSLPVERKVCSQPIAMGHAEGIDCGFILFIQDGKLMIECHTWGAIDVPDGFREKDVRVEIANNVKQIGKS
jgi:hypothetical protein